MALTRDDLVARLIRASELEVSGGDQAETDSHFDTSKFRDILVTACGRLCLHRKKINIPTVLAGQSLGIKEVDDGIQLVSFMHYDLGYIDLKQKTLQPLDNPFGPGLSPVS